MKVLQYFVPCLRERAVSRDCFSWNSLNAKETPPDKFGGNKPWLKTYEIDVVHSKSCDFEPTEAKHNTKLLF